MSLSVSMMWLVFYKKYLQNFKIDMLFSNEVKNRVLIETINISTNVKSDFFFKLTLFLLFFDILHKIGISILRQK